MQTIPTWAVLMLAILAGAGLPMLYGGLRPRPAVDPAELAAAIAAALRPAPAAPDRTYTGRDTMDVLADGFLAGQKAPHPHRRTDPIPADGRTVDPHADGRLSHLPSGVHGDDEAWFADLPPRTPQ